MKILVTGGAGFIGSNLVKGLLETNEEKHEIVVIDNLSTGLKENLFSEARFYRIDIRNKEKVYDVFKVERPDIVFHLAAHINLRESVKNPIEDANINVIGSLNLLEASKEYGVKKFIFSSTGGAIYGDTDLLPTPETIEPRPISPYGCAKLGIERYLYYYYVNYGLKYTSLRYSNVYGPRQNPKGEAGVVAIFINSMLQGKNPVIFGDGKQTRDFVYVSDVVRANLLAMKYIDVVDTFNISTAVETDINKLFWIINGFFGNKYEEIHKDGMPGEQKRSCLSYEKAEKILGWKPEIDIEEGLKKTFEYFKERAIRQINDNKYKL